MIRSSNFPETVHAVHTVASENEEIGVQIDNQPANAESLQSTIL